MNTGDPEPAVSLLQEIYGSHTVLLRKHPPTEPDDYARSLLGQQVRVILDRTGDTPDVLCEWDVPGTVPHEDVITEGKLLGFGQGGDFEILEDDGFVHYCWPMLKIERR